MFRPLICNDLKIRTWLFPGLNKLKLTYLPPLQPEHELFKGEAARSPHDAAGFHHTFCEDVNQFMLMHNYRGPASMTSKQDNSVPPFRNTSFGRLLHNTLSHRTYSDSRIPLQKWTSSHCKNPQDRNKRTVAPKWSRHLVNTLLGWLCFNIRICDVLRPGSMGPFHTN